MGLDDEYHLSDHQHESLKAYCIFETFLILFSTIDPENQKIITIQHNAFVKQAASGAWSCARL